MRSSFIREIRVIRGSVSGLFLTPLPPLKQTAMDTTMGAYTKSRRVAAGLAALLLALVWIDMAAAAICAPRVAEKLGVRFVEVCGGEAQAPFWISVAPMTCSAGEHETIDCPSVTPLLAGDSPVPMTARRVAVVDAVSAHRLCALRFAGHVATRAELERARSVLGLGALVVAEQRSPAGAFRFEPLPEWTADGACENPSKPGRNCRFARWPRADAPHAPMAEIRDCDARRVDPTDRAGVRVALGGRCAAPNWRWSGSAAGGALDELPCAVHLPDVAMPAAGAADFRLSCRPPDAQPPRAPAIGGADIAAFRCVVPSWALATFDPAPRTSGAP